MFFFILKRDLTFVAVDLTIGALVASHLMLLQIQPRFIDFLAAFVLAPDFELGDEVDNISRDLLELWGHFHITGRTILQAECLVSDTHATVVGVAVEALHRLLEDVLAQLALEALCQHLVVLHVGDAIGRIEGAKFLMLSAPGFLLFLGADVQPLEGDLCLFVCVL